MTQEASPIERAAQFLHKQGTLGFGELEALMLQTGDEWTRCLDGLSEAQATHQPAPGVGGIQGPASGEGPKWCAKEVLGHYLVTERSLNATVATFAGVEPPPDPGPVVRSMGFQSPEHEAMPLDKLWGKLSEFFNETAALIGRLQGSPNLEATFPHPVFGPLNMKEWLAFHRLHAMDHIIQIERIKSDAGYPR
jgi:hypothetical protein